MVYIIYTVKGVITLNYAFKDIINNKEYFLGQPVEITKVSTISEVCFNENMRGVITDITLHDKGQDSEYVKVSLDFKPFEDYNVDNMYEDFYNAKGEPALKWIETNFYKDGKDIVYALTSENEDIDMFKLVDAEKINLYNNYLNQNEFTNYTSYLENLILNK